MAEAVSTRVRLPPNWALPILRLPRRSPSWARRGSSATIWRRQSSFVGELPFDLARVAKLHPRLVAARELVNAGQVEIEAVDASAWVRGRMASIA